MNGRRSILTVAAALALVAGGTAAGAAIASGPVDSSGAVHGCYTTNAVKGSHFFVLQDAGTSCPRGTTAIMWNQQGPQGPQGSPGPQGPHGAAGPQGPTGTSGWSGQVQLTTNSTNNVSSLKILSQAGPSILSAKADPDFSDTLGIIFTGDNLPTKMFPIAIEADGSNSAFRAGDAVANTSFEINFITGFGIGEGGGSEYTFDYFLPSS